LTVDQQPIPETGPPRHGRGRIVVGAVLAAAILAAALFVVVRSLRSVEPAALPPSLKTPPPDTALVAFRASIRRRVRTLSARCASKRKEFGEELTAEQDSLSRGCDSAIAAVLARVAALDTVKRENRKEAADSVRAEYERAKLKVRVFTRSGLRRDQIDEDSLDAELEKFVSG
jgi:hypothetical protein